MCLFLVDKCLRGSGSDHVPWRRCDDVGAWFLRASTSPRIKEPNVVDHLLRSSMKKLCLSSLAKLTESLLEGRIQWRVCDKRTSNVSLGTVAGQGDKWFWQPNAYTEFRRIKGRESYAFYSAF